MKSGPALEAYLDTGETLLWSGQPKQGVRLQAGDIFLIPFSLMWGGFAFFWEASVLGLVPSARGSHGSSPPIFSRSGEFPSASSVPTSSSGVSSATPHLENGRGTASPTSGVIILKTLFKTNLTSLDLPSLNNLSLKEHKDNSGDILFGQAGLYSAFANSSWPAGRGNITPGFYLLPQARQVYNLIREAQQKSRK